MSDGENDWAQVGLENSCVRYSSEHMGRPAWGVMGADAEEITRHEFCCLLRGVGEVDGGGGGGDANFPLGGSHNHGDIPFTVTIVLQRWWPNQDYFNS